MYAVVLLNYGKALDLFDSFLSPEYVVELSFESLSAHLVYELSSEFEQATSVLVALHNGPTTALSLV